MDRDPSWVAPHHCWRLGLDEDEAWNFVQELVRTLRQQGAVTMPEDVPPNDEIFAPRLGPIYARLEGPDPIHKVLSWLPGRGTNRRIDYTTKVLAKLGSSADPRMVLEGVWRFLTAGQASRLAQERDTARPRRGHQARPRAAPLLVGDRGTAGSPLRAVPKGCTLQRQRCLPRPWLRRDDWRSSSPRLRTATTIGRRIARCTPCPCGPKSTPLSGRAPRLPRSSRTSSAVTSTLCRARRPSSSASTWASCRP